MRILISAVGMLGHKLPQQLGAAGHEVTGVVRSSRASVCGTVLGAREHDLAARNWRAKRRT